MLRGSLRRAIVACGVVVLAAGSLFAVGQSAAAKGQSSRRASVIHLLHRVGPIGSLARRSPSVRANLAGPENPLDPELYRVHSREGQALEGGDAIHEGERPAPHATVTKGVSGIGGGTSFDALNHFDSRYNDGGNQFSGEPPDQGLCASKTREFEIVNSAVQVYTTSGHALIAGTPAHPGHRAGRPVAERVLRRAHLVRAAGRAVRAVRVRRVVHLRPGHAAVVRAGRLAVARSGDR